METFIFINTMHICKKMDETTQYIQKENPRQKSIKGNACHRILVPLVYLTLEIYTFSMFED